MSPPSTQKVLEREIATLSKTRDEHLKAAERLSLRIEAFQKAIAALNDEPPIESAEAEKRADDKPKERQKQQKYPVPLADAAEGFLKDAGHDLHISYMLKQIEDKGWPVPSRETFSSILRKDPRKRFTNKGRQVWSLKAWSQDREASERSDGQLSLAKGSVGEGEGISM